MRMLIVSTAKVHGLEHFFTEIPDFLIKLMYVENNFLLIHESTFSLSIFLSTLFFILFRSCSLRSCLLFPFIFFDIAHGNILCVLYGGALLVTVEVERHVAVYSVRQKIKKTDSFHYLVNYEKNKQEAWKKWWKNEARQRRYVMIGAGGQCPYRRWIQSVLRTEAHPTIFFTNRMIIKYNVTMRPFVFFFGNVQIVQKQVSCNFSNINEYQWLQNTRLIQYIECKAGDKKRY